MNKEEELIKALTEIKDGFDDLWSKCWDVTDLLEENDNYDHELYDHLATLAIDSEERKNIVEALIEKICTIQK